MGNERLTYIGASLLTFIFAHSGTGSGSVVLTQTHPAAPYVCRTGNITLRCQYDGVEGVLNVVWNVDDMVNVDFDSVTLPGHTALDRTESHQDLVIASFADLRRTYQCSVIQSTGVNNSPQLSPGPVEDDNINLSELALASRTTTSLNVTWSTDYPKCYSFMVSSNDSINVTQPTDSDTSHTLTSLQPGTTYRIEVEAVRKGEGADRQRAKVMGDFTTEVTSTPTSPMHSASSDIGVIVGVVSGSFCGLAVVLAVVAVACLIFRRKTVPGTKDTASKVPGTRSAGVHMQSATLYTDSDQGNAANSSEDSKQNYAVLDWQNQRPTKAPDNEWFTVQYSEVKFDGTK